MYINQNFNAMYIALVIIVLISLQATYADDRTEETFYVTPGAGSLSVEAKLTNFKCKFTYAAHGGTNENWFISLETIDGGSAIICTVERHSASYIFFQDFELELTGPSVAISEVDVKNTQRDNLSLGKDEYQVSQNSISSIQGKFKNHLEKVAAFSSLPREDL